MLSQKKENPVILSEAAEYHRAAFGAMNQFSREPKDLRFLFLKVA